MIFFQNKLILISDILEHLQLFFVLNKNQVKYSIKINYEHILIFFTQPSQIKSSQINIIYKLNLLIVF